MNSGTHAVLERRLSVRELQVCLSERVMHWSFPWLIVLFNIKHVPHFFSFMHVLFVKKETSDTSVLLTKDICNIFINITYNKSTLFTNKTVYFMYDRPIYSHLKKKNNKILLFLCNDAESFTSASQCNIKINYIPQLYIIDMNRGKISSFLSTLIILAALNCLSHLTQWCLCYYYSNHCRSLDIETTAQRSGSLSSHCKVVIHTEHVFALKKVRHEQWNGKIARLTWMCVFRMPCHSHNS